MSEIAELRTDHAITTKDGLSTIEDIKELHNVDKDDFTGDGITVAVMDSGLDDSHPVFDGVETEFYDYTNSGKGDDVGHGTAVAGLIATLAPDAKIIAQRIFGDSGSTGWEPIRKAYDALIENSDNVDIVNMSWGARGRVAAIDSKHNELVSSGVRDVVAAGNTGDTGGSPATADKAFSVGATTEDGKMTRFSSYNPDRDNPDVSAIGKNNKLARADGTSMGRVIDEDWVKASGTSFSAPIVSAFVAQYMEAGGENEVEDFEKYARDIPQTGEDGEGIADYASTLEAYETNTVDATSWSFSGNDVIYVNDNILEDGRYEVEPRTEDGDTVLVFKSSE